MRLPILVAIAVMQCGCVIASAQTPAAPATKPSAKQTTKAAASQPAASNQGERKFQQNCSRCHNAPDELRPRITGTVLMHMRVRASLSAADEQQVLHYLAP
jgi:cytochrome c5